MRTDCALMRTYDYLSAICFSIHDGNYSTTNNHRLYFAIVINILCYIIYFDAIYIPAHTILISRGTRTTCL